MSKLEIGPTHSCVHDFSTSIAATVNDQFYLGIDGGASKTHAIITDSSLKLIGEGYGGPANPARVGVDEALRSIEEAISEACARAGIGFDQISSACAALAGVGDPAHYDPMKEALDREFGAGAVELVTDARAALEGALNGEPGVVVIAGTGSIAMGMNHAGREARSGGWGPTLGDEGSGYDIARQALKAVAASFDHRAPRTLMTDLICARLGIETAADLKAVIYKSEIVHAEIASLAELVCEAAQEGDPVAISILQEAGQNLGELAVSVIEKLRMAQQSFRVACVGSVFHSGNVVITPLVDAISRVAPLAKVGPPVHSPAMGAAKLARSLESILPAHR
jgi:N-acetylglucosamine kinase-like BadF-type ATPase